MYCTHGIWVWFKSLRRALALARSIFSSGATHRVHLAATDLRAIKANWYHELIRLESTVVTAPAQATLPMAEKIPRPAPSGSLKKAQGTTRKGIATPGYITNDMMRLASVIIL